jgi:phosphotransferase family enzyme
MSPPPPRLARIVLVTPEGRLLGVWPPMPVEPPWWQDVEPVVEAAWARHGVNITVLRLLQVGEPTPAGIEVTYLAETSGDAPAAEPWDGPLDEHPLRLAYAKPGGPAADLAWAEGVLAEHGHVRTGPPVQVRTWNLSSLWRIPIKGETLWLKVVPPFFAHEGAILQAMAGGPVPRLLGYDGGRVLMREIPGEDLYGASGPALPPMIDLLVGLQQGWVGRTDELLALGLPDLRPPVLIPAIRSVTARNAADLTPGDRALLTVFAADLEHRFAAVADCGLPDTLVHGDAHPGNLRGADGQLTLLDWGDCAVGHPLLDQPAVLDRIGADDVAPLRLHWNALWRAAAPGCEPERASALLAPIAAARQAVIYQGFLDRIEPSEHPYHRADPSERLARAAALLRAEAQPPR